jgi:hypothetical protein
VINFFISCTYVFPQLLLSFCFFNKLIALNALKNFPLSLKPLENLIIPGRNVTHSIWSHQWPCHLQFDSHTGMNFSALFWAVAVIFALSVFMLDKAGERGSHNDEHTSIISLYFTTSGSMNTALRKLPFRTGMQCTRLVVSL